METSIAYDDNDLFLNDSLIQIQDDSSALVQDQIDVLENETEEEIEAAIEDDILELEEEEDETEVTIFSGTITDYLSATNDYDIYSVPLSQGNYLQARLSVPGDYYIRAVSTKNVNTFTTDDIIPYQLKVTPVATPTALSINRLEDYIGTII